MNQNGVTRLFNRNFLLLWQGQLVSQIGNQVHYIALMFFIKHATESATLMGTLSMVAMLPGVILGPIGGTFADIYSRKKIIVISDIICGLSVLSLAGFIYLMPDSVTFLITYIFIISIIIGIVSAFFRPAVAAAIPDLVPDTKVAAANSMNQSSMQISLFFGQGAGGVLFRVLGAPLLFLIDGATYLFSAFSEAFISIPQKLAKEKLSTRDTIRKFKVDTIEGFKFVWKNKGLRNLCFTATFLNFFLSPIGVLLPFFIEDHLKATPDWFGFILASLGVGALVGYALMGSIKLPSKWRGAIIIGILFIDVLGYGIFGLAQSPISALIIIFFVGMLNGMTNINIITTLQLTTPTEYRGRVFGLIGTLAGGLSPIGMGLAGIIADLTGRNIPYIYIACGLISGLLTLLVSLNRDFREYMAFEPVNENNVERAGE